MLMLLRKERMIDVAVAIQIMTISAPTLATQASFEPPYRTERLVAHDTQHSQRSTCKRDAACSGTLAAPFLVLSEESSVSPHRSDEAFAHQDQHTQSSVSDLVRGLRSNEPRTRKHAAKALGRLGHAVEHAMPALLLAAGDNRWDVRADAVWAIGKIAPGSQAVDAVRVLTNALEDPSDRVRWSAAWSLARLGPAAEAAVPALIERLKDPTRKIRASAVSALRKVASQSSHDVIIPALTGLKDDDDELVRQRAAKALRFLKSVSDAAPNS